MSQSLPSNNFRDRLRTAAGLESNQLHSAAPLAQLNSWRIGGPADLLVEPASAAQVAAVVRFAGENDLPLVVIGQGTNLLFDDAGLRGIVLKLGERFGDVEIDGTRIVAEGGAWVPGLACRAMRAGLAGLEHTIGIPGTIGGLVMMNGGSQRRGIGENVRLVKIVDRQGALQQLDRQACSFGYRRSALQGSGAVVVEVELECARGEVAVIRRAMLEDLRTRRGKFPRKQPNCGSVFLSSGEMHATIGPPGRVIEQAGLKGARVGAAEVSSQHANFIVNTGGATSHEVLSLIALIRRTVLEQSRFELCCEVRYVSPVGEIVPAHLAAL
jgi:UDP-N-acetylmuramate dehydrogenase